MKKKSLWPNIIAGIIWGVLCWLFTKNIGLSILIGFIKADISVIAGEAR